MVRLVLSSYPIITSRYVLLRLKLISVMSETQTGGKMDKVSGVVGIMGMSTLSRLADGSWENDGE